MGMRTAKERFEFAKENAKSDDLRAFYEGMVELVKGINEHVTDLERKLQQVEAAARRR